MRPVPRRAAPVLAALAASAALATPASADIFGTIEGSTNFGPPQTNLVKFNVGSGVGVAAPPGVNTDNASELHAALSPNGKRMVFARKDLAAGTNRIIVVDLTTGQSADLFTGFEAAGDPPTTPIFSLDGTKVLTGRKLEHIDPNTSFNQLQASFTETSLANFPGGPFPHAIVDAGGADFTDAGRTIQPALSSTGRFAYTVDFTGSRKSQTFVRNSPVSTVAIDEGTFDVQHPAISEAAGVVVFERRTLTGIHLAFRPLSNLNAASTALPPVVNATNSQMTRPQLTADGRYLAFIRKLPGAIPKLMVWDNQTQLLLNDQGVGSSFTSGDPTVQALERDEGNVALEVVPVFVDTSVNLNSALDVGDIRFTLNRRSDVGIIVQRIVGQTRVLGRRRPKLKLVGRVPLGQDFSARRGGHRARWNLRVKGRKLGPGDYLITPRSITRRGKVRDLGQPRRLRIR